MLLTPITTIDNFRTHLTSKKQPGLLFFSQQECGFCNALRSNVLQPYLRKQKDKHISIREAHYPISNQQLTTSSSTLTLPALQNRYQVTFFPTLLFINAKGQEISERLVGYQPSNEFYWHYFEKAIDKAINDFAMA